MVNKKGLKKYNILHLRKNYERNLPMFINYVRGVDNNRFNHIVCYLGEENGLCNRLSELGYETIYLGFSNKSLRWFNPFALLKLINVIKSKDINLIHAHKHKSTVYAALSRLFFREVSVVSHVHGLSRTRNLKRKFSNLFLLKNVDKIIAVSDSVKNDILSNNVAIDYSKVVTIRNCINLNSIDSISISKKEARSKVGLSEDVFVYGTVGRLVETKGQKYLLYAFSKVLKKVSGLRLVIVGDGPLAKDLKKQVEELNIKDFVLFTGFREDVLEIIRGFDVFVLPSLAEGLSIALLEAMASGLPVIASNVGGIPEVFGSCNCGRLVPPRDVDELEKAMLDIASMDENHRRLLGEDGRRRVEKEFTIENMIEKLTEVYDSLLIKN